MFEVPTIFVLAIMYFVEMWVILYNCSNLLVFEIQNKEIFTNRQINFCLQLIYYTYSAFKKLTFLNNFSYQHSQTAAP